MSCPIKYSVVTATYNAGKTLQRTINSVVAQSRPDVEHIIIDGGSTDDTLQVIEDSAHENLKWISEKDDGIYHAWNKGIALARGEWIAFLGADDVYVPNALSHYDVATERAPSSRFISSRVALVQGERIVRIWGEPLVAKQVVRRMKIAHVGAIHHRTLFERFGGFDTTYSICGDYEFLLRALAELQPSFIRLVTARMSIAGVSNARLWEAIAEARRAKQTAGRQHALICAAEAWWAYIKIRARKLIWY